MLTLLLSNMHRFTLVLFLCFISIFIYGQDRKFVNEFLNIGAGARSHGMFGSMVANVDDATSGYWNPAGLADLKSHFQVSVMHAEWFAGIANYDFISIAKQLDQTNRSAVGVSLIRMGIDNIPYTLNLIGPDGSVNYDNVYSFSASDYALLLNYARSMISPDFSFGGGAKIIFRTIGTFANAWGFGLDAGMKYQRNYYTLGLSAKDISTTFNAWTFNYSEQEKAVFASTGNEIPVNSTEITLPRATIGVAIHSDRKKEDLIYRYLVELDLNFSTDGLASSILSTDRFILAPTLGAEVSYKGLVFVRTGFGNIQRIINEVNGDAYSYNLQPNFGLGLALGRVKLDYALTNIGDLTTGGALYSHIFSLSLDINPKTDVKAQN